MPGCASFKVNVSRKADMPLGTKLGWYMHQKRQARPSPSAVRSKEEDRGVITSRHNNDVVV